MRHLLEFQDFNELYRNSVETIDIENIIDLDENEFMELFNETLNEAAPAGDTVHGGLFDLNDKNTYDAVKNVKTAIINGVKYTMITISDGARAAAEAAKKAGKASAEGLLNLAKFVGKTIIFTAVGVFVVAEMVVSGLLTLASTVFNYAKAGAIKIGASIALAARDVAAHIKKYGKAALDQIKTEVSLFYKAFMKDLYIVANGATKAAQAVAALTVTAYKEAKGALKSATNFIKTGVYEAAKEAKVTAIKIGLKAKEMYNSSVVVIQKYKKEVSTAVKAGVNNFMKTMDTAAKRTVETAKKLEKEVATKYQAAQQKIVQTGKEIASHATAIINALFDSEQYSDGGVSIFESFVIVGEEKFYVDPFQESDSLDSTK